jgi:hypothetical protein
LGQRREGKQTSRFMILIARMLFGVRAFIFHLVDFLPQTFFMIGEPITPRDFLEFYMFKDLYLYIVLNINVSQNA